VCEGVCEREWVSVRVCAVREIRCNNKPLHPQ